MVAIVASRQSSGRGKPEEGLIRQHEQPYVAPSTSPTTKLAQHWPRYPLQRSPKEYDRLLQEVTA